MVNPQPLTCVLLLLLGCDSGLQEPERSILEMLHINRVSLGRQQGRPHPYMRRVYQSLPVWDLGAADGTLVQSFRSEGGPPDAPPGWIWFNVSSVQASMLAAELVLFRKALPPRPVSVTVALHAAAVPQEARCRHNDDGGPPALTERLLELEQRPASGYDVFDVSAVLARAFPEGGPLGFQLRYRDEGGSLVLHQALTQSLYALTRGLQTEPLLVLYQRHQHHRPGLQ